MSRISGRLLFVVAVLVLMGTMLAPRKERLFFKSGLAVTDDPLEQIEQVGDQRWMEVVIPDSYRGRNAEFLRHYHLLGAHGTNWYWAAHDSDACSSGTASPVTNDEPSTGETFWFMTANPRPSKPPPCK